MPICRNCKKELILGQNWYKCYGDNKKHGNYFLCNECSVKRSKKWRLEHPEQARCLSRSSYKNRTKKYKHLIFSFFNYRCSNPNCPIPRDKLDTRALQIDHVNGGAYKEGRRINSKPEEYPKYLQIVYESLLKKEGKYQVLCVYCNWLKRYTNNELHNYSKKESV